MTIEAMKAAMQSGDHSDISTETLIDEYGAIKALIKDYETLSKWVSAELMSRLFAAGESKAKSDQFSVTIQTKTTKVIDRGTLIARGVAIDVVEAATRQTVSDPFVVVRRLGEKD